MAMRSYEAMFLLDTGKMAGDLNKAADTLAQIVTKHGGEVVVHRVWDERRLAYPVKKQRKALYYLMSLKAIGSAITAIEADLKLQEFVIRSMFLVFDPAPDRNRRRRPVEVREG